MGLTNDFTLNTFLRNFKNITTLVFLSSFVRLKKTTFCFLLLIIFGITQGNSQTVVTGDYSTGTTPIGWSQSGIGWGQWGCASSIYLLQQSAHYIQSPALTFSSGQTYSIKVTAPGCYNTNVYDVLINGVSVATGLTLNSINNFTVSSNYTNQNLKVIPQAWNPIGIQKVEITFPLTGTITATGTLTALTTCAGTSSSSTNFSVSGTTLSAGVLVTPPTGFEVSLASGSGYASTVTVGAAGSFAATPVYIRLKSTATAGTYSGNIVLSSTGATSVNVATVSSTVNALPSVSVSPSSVSICKGSGTTVTASGASTYLWSNAAATAAVTISPTSTTTYTVTGTTSGCSSTASTIVTVNSVPTVSVSAIPSIICAGSLSTLTASGATSYLWSTGATSNPLSVTPSSTITYFVTGTTSGCSSTASSIVTVNALPTVSISPATVSICKGSGTTITAATASTYIWSNSSTTAAITISPTSTTTYIVTGTTNGCSSTASSVVTVNSYPTITASASPTVICAGTVSTLSASGATTSYIWSTGASGSSLIVTPSSSITYVVTGSNSGCTSTTTTSIVVNAAPIPSFSVQPGASICAGVLATYTTQASKSNYSWGGLGTLNTDFSISSGGVGVTDNTVVIQWLTTGVKTVTINYSNGTCSAATPTSSTVTTVYASSLLALSTITGTGTVVQGQTGVGYTVPAVTNATGYTWSLPTNASITAGNNTNTITVTYASNAVSGNISVTATAGACATSASSPVFPVTVAPIVTAAASATVDAPFTITFTDNASWRGAISSITVGGVALDASAYSTSTSGQITFTPSASALLQTSGSKTIAVIATGFANTTVTQTIGVGVATKLGITTQPVAPSCTGNAFVTQPVVSIQDQYGNATSSTATVVATVGAGGWTIGGTTSKAAVNGTAIFTDLTATTIVNNATIIFTCGALTSVTSTTFNILTCGRDLYYVGPSWSSGDWNTATNWKVGSGTGSVASTPPTSLDNVFINYSSGSTINLSADSYCNNITFSNSNVLNISSFNFTVSGNILHATPYTSAPFTTGGSGYIILNGNTQVVSFASNTTITNLRQSVNGFTYNGASSLTITTFDQSCGPYPTNTGGGSITPTVGNASIINKNVTTPGAVTNNSPQCTGIGITFTQGTCSAGATCYWVSSTTGTETTGTGSTYISAPTNGTYTVYVRGNNGACWSSAVSASGIVTGNVMITTQPSTTNQTICVNQSMTALSVTAFGCHTLAYQWYSNSTASNSSGTVLSGATASTYTPQNTLAGTLYYYCEVTDATISMTVKSTVSGAITVNALPTVTALASPNPVYTTGILSLSCSATGTPAFMWSNPGGYSSAGMQNPIITYPTTATNSGIYSVTVTGSNGCKNSASTAYVTVTSDVVFDYNGSGDMSLTSSWKNASNIAPTDFNSTGQTFRIKANTTLNANMVINGTGAKFIVGDGSTSVNFIIPSNYSISSSSNVTINVKNLATLSIANSTIPSIGVLDTNSTVNFNGFNVDQTIPVNYYGNLTIANHGTGKVTFQPGITTIYKSFSPDNTTTYITQNNTLVFNGTTQNIPTFTYNNINTEHGGTKTLTGDISINGKLRIGALTKLSAGSKNIHLKGTGKIVTLVGTFLPGTSTIYYDTISPGIPVIAAINYFNLDASYNNNPRILQSDSVISIAGVFTPGNGTYTYAGSTVEFSGTTSQTVPAINPTYNNIKINGGTTSSPSSLTVQGNVKVAGILTMYIGKLTTYSSTNTLTITNTSANAVGGGSTSSYIIGPLTRLLIANATPSSNTYLFPIGDASYLPFSFNNYTASSNPTITIQAFSSNVVAQGAADDQAGTKTLKSNSLSTSEYWTANSSSADFMCKISLGRQSSLGTLNAIAHYHGALSGSADASCVFSSVNGSVSGNSINSSSFTNFSSFAFAVNVATQVVYYSKPGANVDLSNPANWFSNTNGTGLSPANFTADNVTYIVQDATTTATVTSNWNVSGSNANIQFSSSTGTATPATTISIPTGFSISATNVTMDNATLNIATGASLNVSGNLSFPGGKGGSTNTQSVINNYGTINISGNLTQNSVAYSTINNFNTVNLTGDFSIAMNNAFNNSGKFNVTNGSFTVAAGTNDIFTNSSGASVVINNATNATASVSIPGDANMKLNAGSAFSVSGSNVLMTSGTLTISGMLSVENGNLSFQGGGGGITINPTGSLYVFQSDGNSNTQTGLLMATSGALNIVDNGTLYVDGMSATSGSNSVTVGNNAVVSVGDAGLVAFGNSNVFNVSSGGTIDFCGNKSLGADNLGTVSSGATINYTIADYSGVNPGTGTNGQGDFNTVAGTIQVPAYVNKQSCLQSFQTAVMSAVPTANFSGFTSLPISLDYFDVKQNGEIVAVEWTTASEKNNDMFTVLKSYDAVSFDILGDVSGAGTSTFAHSYRLNDENPMVGINYYKLKQTDFDGNATFSSVKSLKYFVKNVSFNVYPNASKYENITIVLNSKNAEDLQLLISDANGRQVFKTNLPVQTGQKKILLIDYTYLNTGTYFVSIIGKNTIETKRIIVE